MFQENSTETQNMWTRGTDTALRCAHLQSLKTLRSFTEVTLERLTGVCVLQVNPELKSHFEERGFRFVGQDVEGERMEVIELDGE